jgi:hypothetical protein
MGKSADWLKAQVDKVSYDELLFRINIGEDKYIFGAVLQNQEKPDYFTISTIYDTIIDLNHKIKYSFYMAVDCNPSESLEEHEWFGQPPKNEQTAIYFIENMVFRTAVLWDMLAQLCNESWALNKPIEQIYVHQFFHDCAQGKKAKKFAKDVYAYFSESDNVGGDTEGWNGNHVYVKEYRDQMTHRNSPNISTMSSYAMELRPPAIYVLKRVTEDYLKASELIKVVITEILSSISNNKLFKQSEE